MPADLKTCLAQDDYRPTAELIRLTLEERQPGRRWTSVLPLHWRRDASTFHQAAALCGRQSARERILGADIVAQFGIGAEVFHDERVNLLLDLLKDRRATVLAAAATAFGHLKDERSVEPLVALRKHPSARVRWGVTFGLLGTDDERAVATLIELSRDPDRGIRDWATFGLGTLTQVDTPTIRAALWDRIDDVDGDTAAEAILGLARRKDERVVEPLAKAMRRGWTGSLILEAASEIGDERLYPYLMDLKRSGSSENWLDEAMESCRPLT